MADFQIGRSYPEDMEIATCPGNPAAYPPNRRFVAGSVFWAAHAGNLGPSSWEAALFRYLPLVLKNCWRNRRRTILTVAGIGISMCLLGVTIAMFHAFYLSDPTPAQALRLVTRNRVSFTISIPRAYQSQMERVPGVRTVSVANWFGGVYKDDRDPKSAFARFAVESAKLFQIYGELRIPEDERKAFERESHRLRGGPRLNQLIQFQSGRPHQCDRQCLSA